MNSIRKVALACMTAAMVTISVNAGAQGPANQDTFFTFSQAVEPNLPPSLAATIPGLPAVKQKRTSAIICSEMACQPPIHSIEELEQLLGEVTPAA